MKNRELLHASLIPGIGPGIVGRFLMLDGTISLYDLSVQDFERLGLTLHASQAMASGLLDTGLLNRELDLIAKHQATWVTINDPEYPQILKTIHLPPTILYWFGSVSADISRTLAVVGARKAGSYAQRVISMLIPPVAEQGISIVSGGALGADTMAHKAALAAQGSTISVIGSGLLRPYPGQNRELFKEIVEQGGAVMSPFPLTFDPLPGNFPARNRIIAGLSRVCLVVAAAEKSGSLITAHFALEQGRDVAAVPGSLDDALSAGCNKLLGQGAHVITCPDDILKLFGYENTLLNQNTLSAQTTPPDARPKAVLRQTSLLTPEKVYSDPILQVCSQERSFEELLEITGLAADALHEKLFNFELDGKVRQNIAGKWVLIEV